MTDEAKSMPPLRITAWGDGWGKTEYVRADALDKYASELTAAQKRVAELETVLLHVNEHAKALQMRCGHVLSKPDLSGVSMFDLMGE